ncbi:MAG: hypothetical protein KDD44_09975 [Bdellovibrionales bacterium]|nr:hypothetical protein [Bdellovibrionales bacterium]
MLIFIHRLFFMSARAFLIVAVPFVVLFYSPEVVEHPESTHAWGIFLFSFLCALTPMFLFKYVIRVRCPRCKHKLDREIIGSGNYDCEHCGASIS